MRTNDQEKERLAKIAERYAKVYGKQCEHNSYVDDNLEYFGEEYQDEQRKIGTAILTRMKREMMR